MPIESKDDFTRHSDDIAVDQFAEVLKAKLADARTKGRSGWQECDPAELSYMLREHVEKGDPRDVANFCMFLWSLGKPIGDARPVVNLQLTPLDGIQVWIDAYTNAPNGPHFMGHGLTAHLLREYLALRKLLAQRTPPPLPETHYNGSGDGSEPLYTADMLHLYASQYAASLALPAGPVPKSVWFDPSDAVERLLRVEEWIQSMPAFDESKTYLRSLQSAIRILNAPITPDEGWKLVPTKPTEEMAKAYMSVSMKSWPQRYLAMLDAAPQPPEASPAVAQPAADERDAQRYRWLKSQCGQEHHSLLTVQHELDGIVSGADLDAAIDNSRAALDQPAEEGGKS